MKKTFKHIALLLCLLFVINSIKAQFYTGSHQEFGKNRVQHINFGWQFHDYKRFRVFYYGGEKTNAQFVARSTHKHFSQLEEFFDIEMEEKIDILVYTKYSDFKQSNIGLTNDVSSNVGGKTTLIGNKIFVYFENDHKDFEKNIREAISRLLVSKLLYGGDWKKVLRTSATLKLPEWFTEGLYSYCGENWNPKIDNIVKDGVLSGKYKNISLLEGEDAIYAGHSLWNYIKQKYPADAIPNIVYMVNVSKSYETAFRFAIGESTKTLVNKWQNDYKKQYLAEEESRNLPKQDFIKLKKRKSRGKITQIKLHPNQNKIAYVSNDLGKYKIWIYDLDENKYTKVTRGSFKVRRKTDESYPLLTWSPAGDNLAYVEEKKGVVNLTFYNLEEKSKNSRIVIGLSKIFDLQYNTKGDRMVFSALKKGQIDIFYYNINGNSSKQLTDDIYDDINPSFIENSSQIIFASNRINDSLLKDVEVKPFSNYHYDLFIYDLNKKRQKTLKRVTNTPLINETHPIELDRFKYTYLGDDNGITNRYVATFDSTIASVDTVINYRYFSNSSILTNYKRSVLSYDVATKRNKIGLLILHDDTYKIFNGDVTLDKMLSDNAVPDTYYENINNKTLDSTESIETNISIVKVIKEQSDNSDLSIANYKFQSEIKKTKTPTPTSKTNTTTIASKTKAKKFKIGKQKEYKVNFTFDNITSQIDQSFLNNSYQLFDANSPSFNNPSLNLFNLVAIKDLMEDYRLLGGINLNFDLIDNNYLVSFEDLKSRIDKKYLFVRQSYSSLDNLTPTKTKTHEFKYRLKYPFNEIMAVAATVSYRNDNSVIGSINRPTLNQEGFMNHLGGTKLEFVYDNTFFRGLNLLEGTRFKLFAEFYHQLDEKQTDFTVIGADFRHYERIHRDLIFAGRFAASTSFGNQKLVYYLGGVDNWLLPRFNSNTVIPNDKGFTYQTIATPMRGFIQNTRFGNSFAVINSELRWPIFKYFSKYPVQSNFLANFQIVGFGDMGAAWTGSNPYSEENSFNKTVVEQKPLTIEIENQREPIIFGYGVGVRSQLFGYFVRFDWAWGIDDGVRQESIRYLSLSLDF